MTSIANSQQTHVVTYTPPPEDEGMTYMSAGDQTLEDIAEQFDIPLADLKKANPDLDPEAILDFGTMVNIPPQQTAATPTHTNDGQQPTKASGPGAGDKKPTQSETPWLDWAKKQLGTEEIPGGKDNKKIVHFLNTIAKGGIWNQDETPWCSAFVNAAMEKAGIKGTDSGMAKSWLQWGDKASLKNAKPGDVVVVRTGSGPNDYHVGLFVSQKNGQVTLLGGNQNGGSHTLGGKQHSSPGHVSYSTYSTSSVVGVREPTDKQLKNMHA